MGRLYYDKTPLETLVIQPEGVNGEKPAGPDFEDRIQKVISLIPSEVIVIYLTMIGLLGGIPEPPVRKIATIGTFVFNLALTWGYLSFMADKGKPKAVHLIFSCLAFIIWAYVTTGETLMKSLSMSYHAAIGSLVLVAFSALCAFVPLKEK